MQRTTRQVAARRVREAAAEAAFLRPHPPHAANGDEIRYRNAANQLSYIGNFSKGLPHTNLGEVDPAAYRALLRALTSGDPREFEAIPLDPAIMHHTLFTSPQAGLAFDLEGADGAALAIPPAPRLDSAREAGEMAELYWMSLLRDSNFATFAGNVGPVSVAAAAADLSAFSDFVGPKVGGNVTPATIFRGDTPGDLAGPFVSQFLLAGNDDPVLGRTHSSGYVKYGTISIDQRQTTARAGTDYLTAFADWLTVQRGESRPTPLAHYDPTPRFIRNMRDLANWVHLDALYEAYLDACLLLLGLGAPFDPGNPYQGSKTQKGFATFGGPHILSLVTEVATRALKAVWFQKWYVHRRLRPEEFGGLMHNHKTGAAHYPIHAELLNSAALPAVFAAHGAYLLPQAFPEGCPTHPSYGAGHATVAGACATILKAWFDESWVLPFDALIADATGTNLVPYPGADKRLTVGGELNKLAANIASARNMAGVHWRTDYSASVRLGEQIAISVLQEQKLTYNEEFSLTIDRFDGTSITI